MEDGAGGTVWFEPGRAIHLWLGQAERNANKRPGEARQHPEGRMGCHAFVCSLLTVV
ncbi:hypothetical protein FHR92_004640 [Fontibacillus solani]|uniref:Uncharacterized protein n=1 Tax=Fontibacillus solani TaxID=1572857 RepID=A0A7W3XU14_9BACL|nr:hypothetical protein [Fontibacillus solani]MBA9088144.1 hypothetical protein [Fontibacillus solani]